ncbi:site-specific integrase [uncultured Draconibacterium sp.]|uniref:site-specific integrase n=1 Tax=uncultured Draconibacterium sp. TaxID=1573823 RepID=UPI0029C93510|nr:site-specific integrase [uncultured Draconibacterium sp.]
MATVTAYIRTKAKRADRVYVRFRVSDGTTQLYHRSKIEIEPDVWDPKKQEIKSRVPYDSTKRAKFDNAVSDRKKLIRSIYDANPGLNSKTLDLKIDQELNPRKYKLDKGALTYFEIFDEFLNQHNVSEGRKAHFRVLKRSLQRYELYKRVKLDIDTIRKDQLSDIKNFLRDEPNVYEERPEIYKMVPESKKPRPRGYNYLVSMMKLYRTFCLWLVRSKLTHNNPFENYSIDAERYGTPIYITIKERNHLYNYDLSSRPGLAIQRDIFVFHCLVGCRVGDLFSLKKNSVIDGAIEYVARKTKDERPDTIRVPLNTIALEILEKYKDTESDKLLPFISEQNYNLDIKEMFEIAGLTRIVTVLNTHTREEEKLPLNKVASSHMARRTFIGNLYKQVKDPNLIGSMSGHKEGSRAFARYRDIDEDMKQDLVKLLE